MKDSMDNQNKFSMPSQQTFIFKSLHRILTSCSMDLDLELQFIYLT